MKLGTPSAVFQIDICGYQHGVLKGEAKLTGGCSLRYCGRLGASKKDGKKVTCYTVDLVVTILTLSVDKNELEMKR